MKIGIAVMAKYPSSHPRHSIVPEWHAWGGQVFDLNDPTTNRKVAQYQKTAESLGCSVRVQRQPLPEDTECST